MVGSAGTSCRDSGIAGHVSRSPCPALRHPGAGTVDVERVVLRSVTEPGARVEAPVEALLRVEAGLITRLPPDHAARVATHPATRVIGALYAGS